MIASGSGDNAIRIFAGVKRLLDVDPCQQLTFELACEQLQAHDADVNCVAWHPLQGELLASAGDDGFIKIWRYHGEDDMEALQGVALPNGVH